MRIYKITNLKTGKIYIGQTMQPIKKRWYDHKNSKRKCPLGSSMKKHGVNAFKIEELCSVLSRKYLTELEIYFINFYNCLYPNGYNLLLGGNASNHKMTAWNKGKKETREKVLSSLRLSHLGQKPWNKGTVTSAIARKKQSAAKLGKHMSPKTEFKPGGVSVFKGKKHTAESRELISKNNKMSRCVMCIETGLVYRSVSAASKKLCINKKQIIYSIKNGAKHARTGLSFKYTE